MAKLPIGQEPGSTSLQGGTNISQQAANLTNQAVLRGASAISNTLINDARNRIKTVEADNKAEIYRQSALQEQARQLKAEQELRKFLDLATKKMQENAQKTGEVQDVNGLREAANKFVQQKSKRLLSDESRLAFAGRAENLIAPYVNQVDRINIGIEQAAMEDTIKGAESIALQNLYRVDKVPDASDHKAAVQEMAETFSRLGYTGQALNRLVSAYDKEFGTIFLARQAEVPTSRANSILAQIEGNMLTPTPELTKQVAMMYDGIAQGIQQSSVNIDPKKKMELLGKLNEDRINSLTAIQDATQKYIIKQDILETGGKIGDKKTREAFDSDFQVFAANKGIPINPETKTISADLGAKQLIDLYKEYKKERPAMREAPSAIVNAVSSKVLNPRNEQDFLQGLAAHKTLTAASESPNPVARTQDNQLRQAYALALGSDKLEQMDLASLLADQGKNSQSILEFVQGIKQLDPNKVKTAKEYRISQGDKTYSDPAKLGAEVADNLGIDMLPGQLYALGMEAADIMDKYQAKLDFTASNEELLKIVENKLATKYSSISIQDKFLWGNKDLGITNYGYPVDPDRFMELSMRSIKATEGFKRLLKDRGADISKETDLAQLTKINILSENNKKTEFDFDHWIQSHFEPRQVNAHIKDANGVMTFAWIDMKTGNFAYNDDGSRIQFYYTPELTKKQLDDIAKNQENARTFEMIGRPPRIEDIR